LEHILEQTSISRLEQQFQSIDQLYLTVLEAAAQYSCTSPKTDMMLCKQLRILTGTIVLLQNPLSIPALALLMGTKEEEIKQDVLSLSAVLLVGPDTDSAEEPLVQIFHPSFRDFLLERCMDEHFSVNESLHHCKLALLCLDTLNTTLRCNMCQIQNPTVLNDHVINPPVLTRIQTIVPEASCYTAQFWMIHLSNAEVSDPILKAAIYTFASRHLFHWVELLSLIGHVYFAIQHLPEAIAWCKVSDSFI
jgi:hypothetical protein